MFNKQLQNRLQAGQFWDRSWQRFWGAVTLGLLASTGTIFPAQAAEQIEFAFQPIGKFTVPVSDLESLAQDGIVSNRFAVYMKLTPTKQRDDFREILRQRYDVSQTTVEQFTATLVGQQMLQQLSQVIKPIDKQDAFTALRKALIQTAEGGQGITIVRFLQQFPSSTIQIDVKQSFVIVRELLQLFQQRDQIVAGLKKQAVQEAQRSPTTFPSEPDFRLSGKYTWRTETLMVHSPRRNVDFPVDLYRPNLPSGLFQPQSAPLIVISHGLGSDRTTFTYLAQHLASQGFVIAVLEHPGSSAAAVQRFFEGFDNVQNPEDWINRPLDVTYLLDTLQKKAQSSPDWKEINLQKVGVLGQSFGGYTAMALAGAELHLNALKESCPRSNSNDVTFNIALLFQCSATSLTDQTYKLRDERVKAVIAVNTIGAELFSQQGVSQIQIPIMLVAGGDDVIAPTVPEQIMPFTWLTSKFKYLALMDKGTHFSFLGRSGEEVVKTPPDLIGPNPDLAKPLLRALSTAFFRVHLRDQAKYRSYLSQTYAKSLSNSPFQLSLLKSLTPEQVKLAAERSAGTTP
jgi:predicted dienelactone hydrolase